MRIRLAFLILFLATSFVANTQSLNNSYITHTIQEKDLLPESIAYDPVTQSVFMGSTRKGKIIKINPNGEVRDFILQQDHDLWMVIGIKIDVKRRILWACSSGGENLVGYNLKDDRDGRPAGIFKFDLDSGKLLNKFLLNEKGQIHFFNDLIIANNGDVYITHMFKEHALYKIASDRNRLEKISVSPALKYPNGIAISNDNQRLYIAHAEGILLFDIKSATMKSVVIPEGLKIKYRESIDGLYYYKNTLIGVQSDIKTVQQFVLSQDGSTITQSKLLEVDHPMMNHPTTGEIVNGYFYYVANAQFESFNKDGTLFPSEKLYEPVILRLKLD